VLVSIMNKNLFMKWRIFLRLLWQQRKRWLAYKNAASFGSIEEQISKLEAEIRFENNASWQVKSALS
jgi:hypothetical protein